MNKHIWDEPTINAVVSGSVKKTSAPFDLQAEAIFAAPRARVARKNRSTDIAWITSFGVAAAAVLVLFLTFNRSINSVDDLRPNTEISFETLVVMDEILENGTGVLVETNLEALQSISWTIKNS